MKQTALEPPAHMEDYHSYYHNFNWQIPRDFNFAFDIMDKWAKDPDKKALLSLDEQGKTPRWHTFYELSRLSAQFANLLADKGIKKGDRVLIILQSIPEWYVAMLGMMKLGAIPMPGTSLLTTHDIAYRLERSEANLVITDRQHVERAEEALNATGLEGCLKIMVAMENTPAPAGWLSFDEYAGYPTHFKRPPDTSIDDPLLIYFTSGTEGMPKMVLHTHGYAMGLYVTGKYVHGLNARDLHLTLSETGWGKAAWGKLFGPWMMGATVVQWYTPKRFDASVLLEILENYQVSTFCAPPTIYRIILQEDLSARKKLNLSRCLSAGEVLGCDIMDKWKNALGLDIHDHYGQTETAAIVGNCLNMPLKQGSIGKPAPGYDVRVVDSKGNELPPFTEGIIALCLKDGNPPGLMREYWKEPELTRASIKHGYFYTGDRAYRDNEGYFWFVGRDDDVIKSSGYRIGPTEVESALMEHPAVMECAVVGVEDLEGTRGNLVKAFIVLNRGWQPCESLSNELQEHVRETTAPYKYPRLIEYIDALPKTISGKILRRSLRQPASRKAA